MKKRAICALLALVLCATLAAPVSARAEKSEAEFQADSLLMSKEFAALRTNEGPWRTYATELSKNAGASKAYYFGSNIIKLEDPAQYLDVNEIILYDLVMGADGSDTRGIWAKIEDNAFYDIFSSISDELGFANDLLDERLLTQADCTALSGLLGTRIPDISEKLSAWQKLGKSLANVVDSLCRVYAMYTVSDGLVDVLRGIRDSAPDSDVVDAADSLIEKIEAAKTDLEASMTSTAAVSFAVNAILIKIDDVLDELSYRNGIVAAYVKGAKLAVFFSDTVLQADELSGGALEMMCLTGVEDGVRRAIDTAEADYISEPDSINAQRLVTIADFYKNMWLYGVDTAYNYVAAVQRGTQNVAAAQTVVGMLTFDPVAVIDAVWNTKDYSAVLKTLDRLYGLTAARDLYYRTQGMKNFAIISDRKYEVGIFNDVNENAWYGAHVQRAVATAYELGIVSGKGSGRFDPGGQVLLSEVIKMACVVNDIYYGGDGVFAQGDVWFDVYVEFAISRDIILRDEFTDYAKPATRAQMAHIFARALPVAELAGINVVDSLPDVTKDDVYGEDIFLLYLAGVLTGSDNIGTFNPNSNITRAEASAIISRLALIEKRVKRTTSLVYEIYREEYMVDDWMNMVWSVPEIALDKGDIPAINARIYDDFRLRHDMGEGSGEPIGMEYEYYVSGDHLSLILYHFSVNSFQRYVSDVYCIDLSTGERLTNGEILALKGISRKDFDRTAPARAADCYDVVFSDTPAITEAMREIMREHVANSQGFDNSSDNVRMYLRDGNLWFIGTIESPAGSGYMQVQVDFRM